MVHQQKSPFPHLPPRKKHLRLLGLLGGLGFVMIGFLVWFFFLGAPIPTAQKGIEVEPASPAAQSSPGPRAASASPSVDSAAILRSQLEQVFIGIREANQKKDLPQLLNYYSSNFAQLTQRAQSISKAWKIYDYPKMEFEIYEIKLVAAHTAVARVSWEIEAQNISTQKRKNISKTYSVRFVKESDQWRIKALDEVQ